MADIIPDEVCYFFNSNGDYRWVSDIKNTKGMARGRETCKGGTEEIVKNKNITFATIKDANNGTYCTKYSGFEFLFELPNKVEVAIPDKMALDIITHSTIINGKVTCPLVWVSGSTYCQLVREGSVWHDSAVKASIRKKEKALSKYQIIPGNLYETESGHKVLYLGYGSWEVQKSKWNQQQYKYITTDELHEGHFWDNIYRDTPSQTMIDNYTKSHYEITGLDVLKSTRKVIKDLGSYGITLETIKEIGMNNHPNNYQVQTLKVGK